MGEAGDVLVGLYFLVGIWERLGRRAEGLCCVWRAHVWLGTVLKGWGGTGDPWGKLGATGDVHRHVRGAVFIRWGLGTTRGCGDELVDDGRATGGFRGTGSALGDLGRGRGT